MRATGRVLLRSWLNFATPRCNIALDTKNAKVKFSSIKPIEFKNIVKKVKPFGRIVVDLPYDVKVEPTDPHEYPNMDTVLVKLFSDGATAGDESKDFVNVDVTNEECKIEAKVSDDEGMRNITCLVQTPVRYDVDVKTVGEANVEVNQMISDSIMVQTEYGNIVGSKLQGKQITLSSSDGGSVTIQKSIQGNIEINAAGDGFVDADKCLGTRLDVSTENGYVKIGSNYCEKATFTTLDGNLELNNLHMDSSIDIHGKGTLNISCIDGSLQANLGEGSAKIQLARITKDSLINSSGDVNLTIPENLDNELIFRAANLDIDTKIHGCYDKEKKEFIGKNKGVKFAVESSKTIRAKQACWMDTFKVENTPK